MNDSGCAGPGILLLVGTPIGNRGDLSPRARQSLAEADLILCEDTRSIPRLLDDAEPAGRVPRMSCFAANESSRVQAMLERLAQGKRVAFISEAGMPGMSDPGTRLAQAAIEAGYLVDVIPGPCAAITALVGSGFHAQQAVFVGFIARAGARRRRILRRLADQSGALMFYESGRRVAALLDALADPELPFTSRRAVIARELTKLHQEFIRGTIDELRQQIDAPLRGEVCVVVEGRGLELEDDEDAPSSVAADGSGVAEQIRSILGDDSLRPRQKAKALEKVGAGSARDWYDLLARLRGRDD